MPSKLITLISNARLREAIDLLLAHPKYLSDKHFQTTAIMLSGQLNSIEDQETKMLVTPDYARMQRAKITNSILETARRYDIDDSNGPDPSQESIINENKDTPKILFLASDPREVGKLNLTGEFVEIGKKLGKKAADFTLQMGDNQRPDTLIETLLEEEPTYVHFAGHGEKGIEGFNPAGIVLQDIDRNPVVVSGPALARTFRILKKQFEIKLVLLNLCDSMEQARAISANGIHSIGMAKEIPDNMAITFAGGFYLGLAQSPDDIPKAFDMAVTQLMVTGYDDSDIIPRLFFNEEEVTL